MAYKDIETQRLKGKEWRMSHPNYMKDYCKIYRLNNPKPRTGYTYKLNEKICYKCKSIDVPLLKSNHNFRGNKKHQYYVCRECNNTRLKKYYRTENGKLNIKKNTKKMDLLYPEKYKARAILNWNLRSGKISKPKICDICGETKKLQGHHSDYSKPLSVQWLCINCHSNLHRNLL